jgi:class 3 adenylate cyclase
VRVGDIAYAECGETHIAYRVIGEVGRVDVVMVAGALFPFELLAEDRVASRFTDGLAALGRVVVFDKRGVGLSDPIADWSRSVQEQWAEDLIGVVEAAGLARPVLVSWDANGVARIAVSARPDLFAAMVLVNPAATTRGFSELLSTHAGQALPNRTIEELAFPSRIKDAEFTAWLARSGRSGASPSSAARIWEHVLNYEEPLTPPGITTPTLVLHNRECRQPEDEVRAVADAIAGATFVQVAGRDVYPIAGDVDVLITEIAEFVTGGPSGLTPLRHLAAVLFTDLVGSTTRAVDEGDAHWRDLLDIHDRTVRECVRHHGGRVVKYTGDGVLALMPSATGALDAVTSIRERLAEQGLHIRAGIHVGDVDLRGDDVSGLAVNIAARIMSQANANETLVSETTRRATLGSAYRFDATGTTKLKGLPEHWTLHRNIP